MHLVGFIIKKFVTMHGHMNVKLIYFGSHLCYNTDSFRKTSVNIFCRSTKKFPLYYEPEKIRRDNSPRHTPLPTCLAGLFLEYPS